MRHFHLVTDSTVVLAFRMLRRTVHERQVAAIHIHRIPTRTTQLLRFPHQDRSHQNLGHWFLEFLKPVRVGRVWDLRL